MREDDLPGCCRRVFLNCSDDLCEIVRKALSDVDANRSADVYDLVANEFLGMANPPAHFLRQGTSGFELKSTDEIRSMLSPDSFADLIDMLRRCLNMKGGDVVESDIVYRLPPDPPVPAHHVCRPLQYDQTGKPWLILDVIDRPVRNAQS